MQLQSLQYSENEGNIQEWTLEGLTLGPKNLIVGKNATGKSRTINAISIFANYLAGTHQPGSGVKSSFIGHLKDNDKTYQYSFNIDKNQVIYERLMINGELFLDRGEGVKARFAQKKRMTYFALNPQQASSLHSLDEILFSTVFLNLCTNGLHLFAFIILDRHWEKTITQFFNRVALRLMKKTKMLLSGYSETEKEIFQMSL